MPETLDYIESFFAGRCTETERQQFEERCVRDEAFAQEVALYIQARQLLKEELLAAKKAEWLAAEPGAGQKGGGGVSDGGFKRQKRGLVRILYMASAAAAVVILLFVYLVTGPQGPRKLAGEYIHTHYDRLSQTLDGTRDSLAQGITAYNNRAFTQALDLFTALAHDHAGNTDARLYSGLTYLRLKNYDQALQEFDTLANMSSLYSNPGPFLKAVTLLERNAAGDRETARAILQDVVRRNLDGSREAGEWLKRF
jgi:tetratricopeptide (TPR) repeat protein